MSYAGSHGMDIMVATTQSGSSEIREEQTLFQPASSFLPVINEVFRSLVEGMKAIEGATVENNLFCVSVHYRNVDEKLWNLVEKTVSEVMQNFQNIRLTNGHMVFEIRPTINWDKGKAVEYLLDCLGLDSEDVLTIYIGDDQADEDAFKADEDAFKVLRQRQRGFGILVSQVRKDTKAVYTLKDPSEVMEFLTSLASWREHSQR